MAICSVATWELRSKYYSKEIALPGQEWDRSADVVIIGYGMAGAVAAITAHDLGARVIVLEKQPADEQVTNSSLSGGIIVVPSNVDGAIRYMENLCRADDNMHWTESDVIRAWAERSYHNKEWIEALGCKLKLVRQTGEHRDVPGTDSISVHMFPGRGLRMMEFLYDKVRNRGIEVIFNARALKLEKDPGGAITGVRALQAGKEIAVQTRKATILACGGFEFDEQMKLNYLGAYPVHFWGSTSNTGDGIRMAQDVGADLWHMNCCSASVMAKFPDYPIGFFPQFGGPLWLSHVMDGSTDPEPAGYIVVDRNGRRFINENTLGAKIHCAYYEFALYDSQRLLFPRVPSFWIFDQKRIDAGPLPHMGAGPTGPLQLYNWSRDNSQEIKKGWIVVSDSLTGLAEKLGLDGKALETTVDSYNRCCLDGKDQELGRTVRDLVSLSRPPYYGVRLHPGGPNTQGGPKRNAKSQVLDTRGKAIPRLYAVGELGSIFGKIYPSGGANLSECIAFGRIAGENAATEVARAG